MEQDIKKLMEISESKTFQKGEYIFYENQAGREMYLVLSGSVGIYIGSLSGDPVVVHTVNAGGFFGEMAVFDKGKRSASAAAIEETICAAVDSENLNFLIENCPQITHKILCSLSERIRTLNKQLYPQAQQRQTYNVEVFHIPEGNEQYELQEENTVHYLDEVSTTCPICKQEIEIPFIRYAALECERIDSDFRIHYKGVEPLRHAVYTCQKCGYANLDSEFLKDTHAPAEIIQQVLEAQRTYINSRKAEASKFSKVMDGYYKALHFVRSFYPENLFVQARLRIKIYWLYQDAGAAEMIEQARKEAIDCYREIYDKREALLHTSGNRQRCAAIIGELCFQGKDAEQARYYLNEVLTYPGDAMKANAYDRIYELREMEYEKEKSTL